MPDNQIEQPQNARPFNPQEHMMQIKNRGGAADYLPVAWRLVWFREVCPHGAIETEELEVDLDRECEAEVYVWNNETRRSEKVVKRAKGYARYRAVVTDGKGGKATGTKTERAVDFPDFVEKAETGAIGRALAALGYGTQFTGDEFDERHRIVDSPVDHGATGQADTKSTETKTNQRASSNQAGTGQRSNGRTPTETEPIDEAPATEAQLNSLRKLYEHFGFQMPKRSLTYAQAKKAIQKAEDELRKERDAKAVPLDQVSAEMAQKAEATV